MRPLADETREDYVARFMRDASARRQFPMACARQNVARNLWDMRDNERFWRLRGQFMQRG
jgi:hypothetical protein